MRLSALFACLALLAAPAAMAAEAPPPFTLPLDADHPLAGKIWLPAQGRLIDADALADLERGADFVLLGETHDNPDHHALQAWLLRRLTATGIKPLVAFEMLDASQAPAMSDFLSTHPRDASGLGAAVGWEKSGWPDWDYYRPIAQAALDAGAALAAANLSHDDTRAIAKGNIPVSWSGKLGLETAQAPAERQAMEEDIQSGHCNMLPERALPAMVRVQRARDAALAHALLAAPHAVLIAGAGHVRTDRAVPRHLATMAPQRKVLAVAFLEVLPGKTNPQDYAESYQTDRLPFDAVWFTPRQQREDPCVAFKRHMEQKKD